MKISKNQQGFAHLQIILIALAVVLVGGFAFWRVTNNNSQLHGGDSLSQEEIESLASEAEFIDEDHDLIPKCTDAVTTGCEENEDDSDVNNNGIVDSEEDDLNDDSDRDGSNDSDDDDDDNDGLGDNDDPDDDNDGTEDSGRNRGSGSDDSNDDSDEDENEAEDEDDSDENEDQDNESNDDSGENSND